MGKKQDKPKEGKDIQMYTGTVRLYSAAGQKDPVEDMMIERYPATSIGNAHAFLIEAARQWLDENGYGPGSGCQVLHCGLDGEPVKAQLNHVAQAPRNVSKHQHAPNNPKPSNKAWKAYSCPIVALCEDRFEGKVDRASNTIFLREERP